MIFVKSFAPADFFKIYQQQISFSATLPSEIQIKNIKFSAFHFIELERYPNLHLETLILHLHMGLIN